jgi:hypothetical protein
MLIICCYVFIDCIFIAERLVCSHVPLLAYTHTHLSYVYKTIYMLNVHCCGINQRRRLCCVCVFFAFFANNTCFVSNWLTPFIALNCGSNDTISLVNDWLPRECAWKAVRVCRIVSSVVSDMTNSHFSRIYGVWIWLST